MRDSNNRADTRYLRTRTAVDGDFPAARDSFSTMALAKCGCSMSMRRGVRSGIDNNAACLKYRCFIRSRNCGQKLDLLSRNGTKYLGIVGPSSRNSFRSRRRIGPRKWRPYFKSDYTLQNIHAHGLISISIFFDVSSFTRI